MRCGWITNAHALGQIGDPAAVPELARILAADETSPNATPSLGAINEFGTTWNHKYLGKVAAEAMEAIGTPEALEAVEAWFMRGN